MLEDPEDPVIEVLQVFGHMVLHQHYCSHMSSVHTDKVDSAWRAISENHLPEGRRDPWKPLGSHIRELNKRLSCMIRHYGFQDPPPQREKSVPLSSLWLPLLNPNWTPSTSVWRIYSYCPLFLSLFLRVNQEQLTPPHDPISISRHEVPWR